MKWQVHEFISIPLVRSVIVQSGEKMQPARRLGAAAKSVCVTFNSAPLITTAILLAPFASIALRPFICGGVGSC